VIRVDLEIETEAKSVADAWEDYTRKLTALQLHEA
jgi:hypothetical protein